MLYLYLIGLITSLGALYYNNVKDKEEVQEVQEDKELKYKLDLENKFDEFFKDKKICNRWEAIPKVLDINLLRNGFSASVDISSTCDLNDISKHKNYLRSLFKSRIIDISEDRGIVLINSYYDTFIDKHLSDTKIDLYKPIWGYDIKGNIIYSDMFKTAHVGIIGASLSGKSYMVEGALNSVSGADIVLINAFENDFSSINAQRINEETEIEEYLKNVLINEKDREIPLYIVIDECNVLSIRNRNIDKYIKGILAQGRHNNVYIIAIMQLGLKEDCSFRNLLNVRIAFSHKDFSMITNFLGVKEELLPANRLEAREFFVIDSSDVRHGKTYLINKKEVV